MENKIERTKHEGKRSACRDHARYERAAEIVVPLLAERSHFQNETDIQGVQVNRKMGIRSSPNGSHTSIKYFKGGHGARIIS